MLSGGISRWWLIIDEQAIRLFIVVERREWREWGWVALFLRCFDRLSLNWLSIFRIATILSWGGGGSIPFWTAMFSQLPDRRGCRRASKVAEQRPPFSLHSHLIRWPSTVDTRIHALVDAIFPSIRIPLQSRWYLWHKVKQFSAFLICDL